MSKYFPIVMSLYDLVLFNTGNSYLVKAYTEILILANCRIFPVKPFRG